MSTKKTTDNSSGPTPQENKPEVRGDAELLELSGALERKYADEIEARVAAGLTREQAVVVQRAQVAHDLRGGSPQG